MRLRVLIIDHDPARAGPIADALAGAHAYVEIADNGIQAFGRLRSAFFNAAIVCDSLPETDGRTLVRAVRATLPGAVPTALVALTADRAALAARERAEGWQFDAIVTEPCDPAALVAEVARCVAAMQGAAAAGAPPPEAATPPGDSPRILVVDDDDALRALLRHALGALGSPIDEAPDAITAMRFTSSQRYAVVVMDYQMPALNGLSATRMLYGSFAHGARPRFIAYTAALDRLRGEDPEEASLFDVRLSKAEGFHGLIAAVRECLDYRAPERVPLATVERLSGALAPADRRA